MSAEKLPTYWPDVNRFGSKLLANVSRSYTNFIFGSLAVRQASWEAEEPYEVERLLRGTFRSIGGIRSATYHELKLLRREPDTRTLSRVAILFDPERQIVHSATESLLQVEEDTPRPHNLRGLVHTLGEAWERLGAISRDPTESGVPGMRTPGSEDYDLLLSELRRGAERI